MAWEGGLGDGDREPMKVSACTVIHYGSDYAGYALRSVYDAVDEAIVCYTPHPSHGTRTAARCPETREQVRAAVDVGPKVRWHEVDAFWQEGKHRDYALSLCKGELVLVVDADEVWAPEALNRVLQVARDGRHRDTLVACLTPWRSFHWLCRDDMMPVRVIRPGAAGVQPAPLDVRFWHFGYAIRDEILRYKISIHGHRGDPGWNSNWYEEKWLPWPPVKDVHPTHCGPWNPEPFDKNLLPAILREHPFWSLDKIE